MDPVIAGFIQAFQPENLLFCFIGVFIGTLTGVLPGIGSIAAVSLLLPFTFSMDPTASLVMLAGIYYGSEYGGSVASILLNLPGSVSNAVTCLDGFPMAKKGRAGVALFITTASSFVGGAIGILLLVASTPLILKLTLSFGSAEYFAAMLLGLIAAATISSGSPIKGICMVVFGVLLGTVGTDVNTGVSRFSFGLYQLAEGFSVAVVAMGVFGVSEIIASVRQQAGTPVLDRVRLRSMLPNRAETMSSILPTARGSAIGAFFGVLPGTGPSIASFLSYVVEKRISRTPERFGSGAIEGIAAPEAANNAAAQTAFIPTLSLGIPGTASMAILLGAMLIHGISPGPQFVVQHPDIFWALVASFWIGNVMLVILNIPLIGVWVRMLSIPYKYLYPAILVMLAAGLYSINGSIFDVWMVLLFGIAGYLLRLAGFPLAPLLVGFILGPMLEENFRRTMMLLRGDFSGLLSRPISLTILAICVALLLWSATGYARRTARR